MKQSTFFLATIALIIVGAGVNAQQNIGIGGSPDPSAKVDIQSTSGGFLMPRLSTVQRDSIVSPAVGLMIFNSDCNSFNVYANNSWVDMVGNPVTGPPNAPTAGTQTPLSTQITWNWNTVTGATGYKYNTANNYSGATDNGINTSYTQTGLTCGGSSYTLYVWAYNGCGHSAVDSLTQLTSSCCSDAWTATSTSGAPSERQNNSAVWTGSVMIVWGGNDGSGKINTGGKYDPVTDTWTATSTTGAPDGRGGYSVVWANSVMIVWGGNDGNSDGDDVNTGGKYDPVTDTWTATNTSAAPSARRGHDAVWTGSEMIVWGGYHNYGLLNTGGIYNPGNDTWTTTSTSNAPGARDVFSAVWDGSEMIVWGGYAGGGSNFNTGGRYNPANDTWTATSTTGAPEARQNNAAVWDGSEMIVWGGTDVSYLNTGGKYNPISDSWIATSTSGAPDARENSTKLWTGSEMIVWGGDIGSSDLNTGGKYNPITDSWTATSTSGVPSARNFYQGGAVWTGNKMIVWGGDLITNTGGQYCP